MTTQAVTLFIHHVFDPSPFEEQIEVSTYNLTRLDSSRGRVALLGTHEIEVPIPECDANGLLIASLEEQLETVTLKARREQQALRDRIASLRCLEHRPSEVEQ